MSLTEYALVFAVLAVGTLAATQYLGAEAENETEQQATCVSERPPPPSCQIPTAATSTTTTISPGPSSSTTSTPVTIAPPVPGSVVTGTPTKTGTAPGPWQVSFPVTSVRDGDGVPVAGVVVRFAIYISNGTTTVFSGNYASCTTDALGSCTATYTQTPEAGVTIVQAVISDIDNIDPEPTFSTTPIPVTL